MTKAPLAILTMVYNEPEFLPVWLRHYRRHVDETALYLVDHGSDDGSTDAIGSANRIRIPRSPQNDEARTRSIAHICSGLLEWYDTVIYTDVDELLVVDPEYASDLSIFAQHNALPWISATGLDVVHRPDDEPVFDWSAPVGIQRHWVRFTSSMCKPVLIRRPVTWSPGFHNVTAPPALVSPLFLFHLRYVDMESGLRRLHRTRSQAWSSASSGLHQRMPDDDWANMLRSMAMLPVDERPDLRAGDATLQYWRTRVEQSSIGKENERYTLDLHISGDTLWRIPERFASRF